MKTHKTPQFEKNKTGLSQTSRAQPCVPQVAHGKLERTFSPFHLDPLFLLSPGSFVHLPPNLSLALHLGPIVSTDSFCQLKIAQKNLPLVAKNKHGQKTVKKYRNRRCSIHVTQNWPYKTPPIFRFKIPDLGKGVEVEAGALPKDHGREAQSTQLLLVLWGVDCLHLFEPFFGKNCWIELTGFSVMFEHLWKHLEDFCMRW